MYKDKKILAVIPARGGSKGLPRKNIKLFLDRPLIAWTIEAAKASKYIDKTIVSTDDQNIAKVSRRYGAEIPFLRPKRLSRDSSSSEDVAIHSIESFRNKGINFDIIVLLQPTSPLRRSDHIDSALNILEHQDCDAVISVCEPAHHPLKSFKPDEHGFLIGLVESEHCFSPRQQLPKALIPNGAIFLIKSKVFNKYKSFLPPRTLPFVMPGKESIDIDGIDDLDYVSFLLSKCVTSTKS